MKIVDGTELRALHVALPDSPVSSLTVPQLIDLAESEASRVLFNRPTLPLKLKSSALSRLNINVIPGPTTEEEEYATILIRDFLYAIADVLYDDPMLVSVFDGNTLKLYLEDEDEFAMLAENLFTQLDMEETGKIRRVQLRDALFQMGVEWFIIPPFKDYPLLNDILKKHGIDGEGELGQSQFAELLQPILQEVADGLSEKHVTVFHDVKIINGSKLRQILADEQQMDDIIGKISNLCLKENQRGTKLIRNFVERNGQMFGLPPMEEDEAVVSLYDAVFADIDSKGLESDDELRKLVKEVLEKMAEQLDAKPVICDSDH